MNRTLFIIIVLYVIWRVLHAYGRRMDRQARGAEDFSKFSARRRDRVDQQAASTIPGGDLVPCSSCGVLIPQARTGPEGSPVCGACRDRPAGT